jgi:hypothetical protein
MKHSIFYYFCQIRISNDLHAEKEREQLSIAFIVCWLEPYWEMFRRMILFGGENAMLENLSSRSAGKTDAFIG